MAYAAVDYFHHKWLQEMLAAMAKKCGPCRVCGHPTKFDLGQEDAHLHSVLTLVCVGPDRLKVQAELDPHRLQVSTAHEYVRFEAEKLVSLWNAAYQIPPAGQGKPGEEIL